jgi:hypothetical protein
MKLVEFKEQPNENVFMNDQTLFDEVRKLIPETSPRQYIHLVRVTTSLGQQTIYQASKGEDIHSEIAAELAEMAGRLLQLDKLGFANAYFEGNITLNPPEIRGVAEFFVVKYEAA